MRLILCVLLCNLGSFLHGETSNKVIVVGAGLAGLTSAYRLKELGYEVEIYEARARPGGRVCTAYFGSSHEELGGKNIRDGGEAKYIRALIKELGLKTQTYPLDVVSGTFLFDGVTYSIQELVTQGIAPTESLHQKLLQQAKTAKNLEELIAPLFENHPPLANFVGLNIRGIMGSPASELSAHYLDFAFWNFYEFLYEGATSSSKSRYFEMEEIVGGNSRLIEALVKELEGQIHYRMPLRKITFQGRLRLHFDDTTTTYADHLILAIPASTLRDVEIDEALIPKDQLVAIRTQQYGTNAKILVPFQENRQISNVYHCFEEMGTWLNKQKNIMTCYYGGIYGDFNATQMPGVFQRDLGQLQNTLPEVSFSALSPGMMKDAFMAKYSGPVAVSWINEPFSKGSYSNLSPEQFAMFEETIEIQGQEVRKVYRPIDGTIFFAGEHTSVHAPSSMEGAVSSGEQAALLMSSSVSSL